MSQGGAENNDSDKPAPRSTHSKPGSGSSKGTPPPASSGPGSSGVRRPANEPAKAAAPQHLRLGSYRIVERIGAGGMGTVYRAVHVELDREVALKVLPPEMNSNPTMVARFKREAKAAAQLQHENIVQIYDVSEDKGRIFLALEFVHGKDLSDIIYAKKHLPFKRAIDILKQAARALDHAFQKGIVHRDIKPSNFLITKDGKVKLCDMGLALRTDAGEEAKVTRDGTTVGTVDYMSPEQARDSRLADTRSDIYSLGCTLYQMLTNRVPFEEGSIPEKLFKHTHDPVPDPLQFNPDIPPAVLYVLNRMLEKRPQDRYQNPKELLSDLEQLEKDLEKDQSVAGTLAIGTEADEEATEELVLQRPGGRSSLLRQQEAARQAAQRKLIMLIGGAASVFLVAAYVAWLIMRPDRTKEIAAGPDAQTTHSGSKVAGGGPKSDGTPSTSGTAVPPPSKANEAPPGAISTTKKNGTDVASGQPSDDSPGHTASKVEPDRDNSTVTESSVPARVSAEDREKIAQELFPPWPTVSIPTAPVQLARGVQQESGGVFSALEAACRKAQSGSSKIHVEDCGPFFERSFSVNKANLEIRPVFGERQQIPWRPLVVFDVLADKGKPYAFQTKNSNLYIEGIDFVINADDLRESIGLNPFSIFDIQGGDLVLKNCTFTILGKHAQSVSLVKFSGLRDPDPTRQPERLARLALEGCFARGEPLTVVTLASGLSDIKIIDSLCVGGAMGTLFELPPPLDPTARPERTLRLIRSTFVTRGDFLNMDGSSGGDVPTSFKLLDTIIASASMGSARKLIRLKSWPDHAGVIAKATWDERSVLYTGWGENLIYSGPMGKFSAKTPDDWLRLWSLQPADSQFRPDAWPKEELGDPATVPVSNFGASQVAAGIQSRWGAPSIGCTVDQLMAPSPLLHERSFGRIDPPSLLAFERVLPSYTLNPQKNQLLNNWLNEQNRRRQAPPGTLAPGDELDPVLELPFHANTDGDLGKFLMSQPDLPDTTIVKVTGTGTHVMSPIRLAGRKSLIVYVLQTPGQLLAFVPAEGGDSVEALIEVRDGDLILEGVVFVWPPSGAGNLPRRFIKVDRGNLTLAGCRLYGPLQGDLGFEAIAFAGSAQKSVWPKPPTTPLHMDFHPAPHPRVNVCQLIDCYIGAEARCIAIVGSRFTLRLSNCVAVTPGTLVTMDDLDVAGAQNFEADVIVDQSTLAASKAFFDVGDWIAPALPTRPMVFSTRDTLYCDPFDSIGASGRLRSNVMLRYAGRTLQHGLLAWHSEYDAFSNDIHAYVQRRDSTVNPRQEFVQHWLSLWGRPHVSESVVDEKRIDKVRLVGKPNIGTSMKLKDFDRDHRISDLGLQEPCEATKKASHGGRIGADLKRIGVQP